MHCEQTFLTQLVNTVTFSLFLKKWTCLISFILQSTIMAVKSDQW